MKIIPAYSFPNPTPAIEDALREAMLADIRANRPEVLPRFTLAPPKPAKPKKPKPAPVMRRYAAKADARDAVIKRMRRRQAKPTEIAAELGVSVGLVQRRLREMGLSYKHGGKKEDRNDVS